jgi:hypothetical protein
MGPLALTDEQLAAVRELAEPIPPHKRDEFLRLVADNLAGTLIGDGDVQRAAAAAQREVLRRKRRWP